MGPSTLSSSRSQQTGLGGIEDCPPEKCTLREIQQLMMVVVGHFHSYSFTQFPDPTIYDGGAWPFSFL